MAWAIKHNFSYVLLPSHSGKSLSTGEMIEEHDNRIKTKRYLGTLQRKAGRKRCPRF